MRLARLRAEPGRAAVLLDVDGTLAPIVARPELAAVPDETRERSCGGSPAATRSSRASADGPARRPARLVGVDGVVYVGVHGLELAPEAERWRAALRPFAADSDWPWLEDKGLTVAFHWREAADEKAARARARGRGGTGAHGRARGALGPKGAGAAAAGGGGQGNGGARRCSPSAGSSGRSTPATTRPTSTPSAGSTGSRWAFGSRSPRPRRRRGCARPPTSWSTRLPSCSTCCGCSEKGV